MTAVIDELVGGLGSNQFGPKIGGYNVLNAPDGSYSLAKNLDWLGTATNRADRIVVTDNPMEVSNLFRSPANVDLPPGIDNYTPEQMANYLESIMDVDILNQMTVFGRETKALADNNYIYRPELREFKIN